MVVGSLFAGICSLKEHDASLPQKLVEWFEESFEDVVGIDSVDICKQRQDPAAQRTP